MTNPKKGKEAFDDAVAKVSRQVSQGAKEVAKENGWESAPVATYLLFAVSYQTFMANLYAMQLALEKFPDFAEEYPDMLDAADNLLTGMREALTELQNETRKRAH